MVKLIIISLVIIVIIIVIKIKIHSFMYTHPKIRGCACAYVVCAPGNMQLHLKMHNCVFRWASLFSGATWALATLLVYSGWVRTFLLYHHIPTSGYLPTPRLSLTCCGHVGSRQHGINTSWGICDQTLRSRAKAGAMQ